MLDRLDDRKAVDAARLADPVHVLVGVPDKLLLSPGAARLYNLLDSLIALRLEFANDMDGEKALATTLGRAKLLAVRVVLDTAIRSLKRVIDRVGHPEPPKRRRRPLVPIRRAHK